MTRDRILAALAATGPCDLGTLAWRAGLEYADFANGLRELLRVGSVGLTPAKKGYSEVGLKGKGRPCN